MDAIISALLDRIAGLARDAASGARPRDERLRALDFRFIVERRYLIFYKATARTVGVYRVNASRDSLRILR